MTRAIFMLTCLLLATGCSRRNDVQQSSRELAKAATIAALESGAFDALIEQATASSYALTKAQIEAAGRSLTVSETRQLQASMRRLLREVFPQEAWEEALTSIVMDSLERSELQQLVKFAETPFGRKVLTIQARVATGGGAAGAQLLQSRQDELTKRLQAELVTILNTRQ